jgi:hypothetical protein
MANGNVARHDDDIFSEQRRSLLRLVHKFFPESHSYYWLKLIVGGVSEVSTETPRVLSVDPSVRSDRVTVVLS